MNILYVSCRIPYPPNKGEKIRAYHHLRHLAAAHDVHLVTFVEQAEDIEGAAALREMCRAVHVVPIGPLQGRLRALAALASGRSLNEGYYGGAGIRRAVARAAAGREFDAVWAYSSMMARHVTGVAARRRIFDFVDVDSEKWRALSHAGSPLERWLFGLEARRVRRLERRDGARGDRVLFVSEAEAACFRSFCPEAAAVCVVPNGVDLSFFRRREAGPEEPNPPLLFVGTLDYRPNEEAALRLVREILPAVRRRIPAARLLVVGRRPTARLLRAARAAGRAVEVTGFVEDVRPFYRRAAAFLAPLRIAPGVQSKLLEAMAMGLPVIASSVAATGLAVVDGTHLHIADDTEAIVDHVHHLLSEPADALRLAESAHQLMRDRYCWERQLPALDACLEAPSTAGGAGGGG